MTFNIWQQEIADFCIVHRFHMCFNSQLKDSEIIQKFLLHPVCMVTDFRNKSIAF